ncbi:hypothetical protein K435DRAFT_910319 [Dendrothele bispora CBS 962.96]|uniref:Uncharacterized protein n=1 Tax=Dendrothele bispora (strain CBS 962.96) TaxID=1314807 RepID=A0A4S8LNY2_DENBC|nr:hypothetical protein K435DRAFT_910319 [Dendrothele bispora CBS 962.96]
MSDNEYGELDDGRENDNNLVEIVLPAIGTNPAVIYQRLREAQLQNQELRSRLSAAQALISNLKADIESPSVKTNRKGRKREAPLDPALAPHRERILQLGKEWTIMHEPWINADVFMRLLPPNAPLPLSSARFATEDTYRDGTIQELHEHLQDARLQHFAAQLPAFRAEFIRDVGSQRTTSVDRPDRGRSELLQSLLMRQDDLDDINVPIFFPNHDTGNNCLFLNEYQPRMIRAVLFGPAAIQTSPEKFKYSTGLVGMKWGVRSVNVACIAWSAILFAETGAASRITYRSDFYEYKKMIWEEERDNTPWAQMLFSFYNKCVFPGLPGAPNVEPQDHASRGSRLAAMRERLRTMTLSDSPGPVDIPADIPSIIPPPESISNTFIAPQPDEIENSLAPDSENLILPPPPRPRPCARRAPKSNKDDVMETPVQVPEEPPAPRRTTRASRK